jgi:hypothetical protein
MNHDHTHDLSSSHNASSPTDLNPPLTALVKSGNRRIFNYLRPHHTLRMIRILQKL